MDPRRLPALEACLRALRHGDVFVVWKLESLGPQPLALGWRRAGSCGPGGGARVLAGHGPQTDTTTIGGRLVFGIISMLAEFEPELMRERTVAGLKAARARGRRAAASPRCLKPRHGSRRRRRRAGIHRRRSIVLSWGSGSDTVSLCGSGSSAEREREARVGRPVA